MSTNTALDDIKALVEKFANLCPDYMYRGIRHLERNCDIECETAEEDEGHDCKRPDRYDGEDMAKVLAAAPKLLAALEAVEALHRPVLEDGEPVGCRVCDWSEDDYWPCATLRNIEEALR